MELKNILNLKSLLENKVLNFKRKENKMENLEIYQQGDVILFKCDKPIDVNKLETDLLHKGQAHHHRLRGKFKITEKDGTRFVHSKGCELFHEEHKTINLPEGFYKMGIVLEYDHQLEESRQVID